MAAVPGFLLRLNTETGRLLQQQDRQCRPIRHWQVVLLLPEDQLPACSKAIRAEAAGTSLDAEIDDVIAAILVSRFNGRTVPEICAMGGITAFDFTSSVAYREIFGLGRQSEASALTLRLLQRRCGTLTPRAIRPESRPCPSARWNPWWMPCSISRVLRTSRLG